MYENIAVSTKIQHVPGKAESSRCFATKAGFEKKQKWRQLALPPYIIFLPYHCLLFKALF